MTLHGGEKCHRHLASFRLLPKPSRLQLPGLPVHQGLWPEKLRLASSFFCRLRSPQEAAISLGVQPRARPAAVASH